MRQALDRWAISSERRQRSLYGPKEYKRWVKWVHKAKRQPLQRADHFRGAVGPFLFSIWVLHGGIGSAKSESDR